MTVKYAIQVSIVLTLIFAMYQQVWAQFPSFGAELEPIRTPTVAVDKEIPVRVICPPPLMLSGGQITRRTPSL